MQSKLEDVFVYCFVLLAAGLVQMHLVVVAQSVKNGGAGFFGAIVFNIVISSVGVLIHIISDAVVTCTVIMYTFFIITIGFVSVFVVVGKIMSLYAIAVIKFWHRHHCLQYFHEDH